MVPPHADARGHLFEIFTTRNAPLADPIVHVYQVHAAPASIRGWNYHARQTDRLCFTEGTFRVVLIDIREDSPTAGARVELELGEHRPALLTIPPFVVHGVGNIGPHRASFLNFPTRPWDPANPDKFRLPITSSLIDGGW